jgi:hypothetical protein
MNLHGVMRAYKGPYLVERVTQSGAEFIRREKK